MLNITNSLVFFCIFSNVRTSLEQNECRTNKENKLVLEVSNYEQNPNHESVKNECSKNKTGARIKKTLLPLEENNDLQRIVNCNNIKRFKNNESCIDIEAESMSKQEIFVVRTLLAVVCFIFLAYCKYFFDVLRGKIY